MRLCHFLPSVDRTRQKVPAGPPDAVAPLLSAYQTIFSTFPHDGDGKSPLIGKGASVPGLRLLDQTRKLHFQGGWTMLVLSRRLGEEIMIDGTIRVSVVSIKRGQIRLGISAPASVTIMRPEVAERYEGLITKSNELPRLPRLRPLSR
jgi:carbon storage regulator